ncbi:complement C1q domain-containing protein [Dyadobacter sp. CY323]|uniref:complement C1q domain-containing protein n=1 Tax=Dyadobacter sp. CY323 TaxID=2907302 RepID=UPI001F34895D|nr:complement C1q domain-containing protein [Dyadobacter sp. CY323]MCE6988233.1 complement C1q domain-containing protein [Dyadobacter sp. CY323]
MKKLILLITTLFFHYQSFSQGVGINTTSPDPSAALDIKSNDKGVLIPKVSLTSLVDKTTISSPANGLLVYNTNANLKYGVGFYFNANTPASPDWKSTSEWNLPYYGATSEPNSAFLIENYQGGQNSAAIKGYSGGSGTGVHARSDGGVALKAEGGVKIFGNGQNPGVGKVLTSDAEGNAKWEGGVAFRAVGIVGGGSESFAPGVISKVPFATELYDLGNNYNTSDVSPHSVFVAPVDGIYHFEAHITWDDQLSEDFGASIYLVSDRNGNITELSQTVAIKLHGNSSLSTFSYCQLKVGDQVSTRVRHFVANSGEYRNLLNTNNRYNHFSGVLISKQ